MAAILDKPKDRPGVIAPPPATEGQPAAAEQKAKPAAQPSAGAAPGTTVDVAIKGNAFSPAQVTVAAGSTVRWTNRDQIEHTATSSSGGSSATRPRASRPAC